MLYQNKIFSLFGLQEKAKDINKDGDEKGTYERYNETIGEDIDENIVADLPNTVDLIYSPDGSLDKFVAYLEYRLGVNFQIRSSIAWRRLVLKHVRQWYSIKGTKTCIQLMFSLIGLEADISETYAGEPFDSDITFDDTWRRFDMRCYSCSYYSVLLTSSTVSIDDTLLRAVEAIIAFNHPINAILTDVTVNGYGITSFLTELSEDVRTDYRDATDFITPQTIEPSISFMFRPEGMNIVSGELADWECPVSGAILTPTGAPIAVTQLNGRNVANIVGATMESDLSFWTLPNSDIFVVLKLLTDVERSVIMTLENSGVNILSGELEELGHCYVDAGDPLKPEYSAFVPYDGEWVMIRSKTDVLQHHFTAQGNTETVVHEIATSATGTIKLCDITGLTTTFPEPLVSAEVAIAEIICFSTHLSDAQVTDLSSYMNLRYRL